MLLLSLIFSDDSVKHVKKKRFSIFKFSKNYFLYTLILPDFQTYPKFNDFLLTL